MTQDQKYLTLAKSIAEIFSKDPSTKVGAVIVRPNNTVASVGYNGFPRGMNDDASLYANREFKVANIVHAEANAIVHAQGPLDGCTIYVWPIMPCPECMKLIIGSGITKVVSQEFGPQDELFKKSLNWRVFQTFDMSRECGVKLEFVPL